MQTFPADRSKPILRSLLSAFIWLLLAFNLLQCTSAAPIYDLQTYQTNPFKRQFIPTDAQADTALAANNFDGIKAMFSSWPANAFPWARKHGRVSITRAYGNYLNPKNPDEPFAGFDGLNTDFETQVRAVLSAAYARATIGTTYVALLPDQAVNPTNNWYSVAWPILRRNGVTVFQVNSQDTTAEPVQIWPPPQQGSPPP